MQPFRIFFKKRGAGLWGCVLAGLIAGCAGAGDDPQQGQLLKQQASTIESLNAEIVRLNEEIDDAVHARAALVKTHNELAKRLSDEISDGDITIALEKRGLAIRFLESFLFEPERIELKKSSQVSLDKVADVLIEESTGNKVVLEGHTDDAIPSETGWRSSWEYTNAMASEVLHYFVDVRGLNPARFTVVACAEYKKMDPRDTEDGRERNRRVEIVITPQKLGSAE